MDLRSQTLKNRKFRKIILTIPNSFQLVLMSLRPKEEIGMEEHSGTTQFIYVESGYGLAIVGDNHLALGPGASVTIPPDTYHNIINESSTTRMQLFTIYTPPEH